MDFFNIFSIMKLDDLLVEKVIIEKDFDQLKKILEDPEKSNKLIAYSNRTGNIIIKEMDNDKIIADYTTGKFKYEISFLRKGVNKIEYQFKATNYYMLIFIIPILIYKNNTVLDAIRACIVFCGSIFLFFYFINSAVSKGIYNRIHNRWNNMI